MNGKTSGRPNKPVGLYGDGLTPPAAGSRRRLGDADAVSTILGTSVRTVRRLAADGRLPGLVRVGRRLVRFDLAVLDGWIDAGCPGRDGRRADRP